MQFCYNFLPLIYSHPSVIINRNNTPVVEPVETTFMEFILKKQSILLTFLLLLTLIFTSCLNNVDQPSQNGTITFAFTTADLDRITGRAAESDYSVEIYLSVNGEIIQKSTSISNGTVAPVTFTDIRTGSIVGAFAIIYLNGLPAARGESDPIITQSGENRLTIRFTRVDTGNSGSGDDDDIEEGPTIYFDIDYSEPLILWNNRTSENELIIDGATGDVAAQAISGLSFTRGAKSFTQATDNMQINTAELPSNVYCVVDNYIYAARVEGQMVTVTPDPNDPSYSYEEYQLTTASIGKYIPSGSGYVKDNTFTDIDVLTLFNTDSDLSGYDPSYPDDPVMYPLRDIKSIAYAELNGNGYFFVGFVNYDSGHNWYLSGCIAIDPSTSLIYKTSPNSERYTDYIPAIEARSNGNSIDLYYIHKLEDGDQTIKKLNITAFGNSSYTDYMINGTSRVSTSLLSSTLINVTESADTLGVPNSTYIGDFKIDGNTLYLALYTNEPASSPIVCNGGIAKYDLSGSAFTNWSNGEKVLGWYKDSDVTVQPPRSLANRYFYGAKKIITWGTNILGQKVLVVADDGAYIDAVWNGSDVSSISSYNMNRIVTVNLATELVSAYNVNVCFDNTVISDGQYFGVGE